MKNFPVFSTEAGVASLVLEEIPYKNCAYITIQSTSDCEALLEDCIGFCRAVGAEKIYGTGDPYLERFPIHTEILEMEGHREALPVSDAVLVSVSADTVANWCELYNEKMKDVPNASTMTQADRGKLLQEDNAYFVYKGETQIGLGKISHNKIEAIVSLSPGQGAEVFCTLSRVATGEKIYVEVASENLRAVRLYDRLGLKKCRTVSKWFRIL